MTQKGSGCDELFEDLQSELSDRPMVCDVILYDENYIISVLCDGRKRERASDFKIWKVDPVRYQIVAAFAPN